jgi:hypothetical protein
MRVRYSVLLIAALSVAGARFVAAQSLADAARKAADSRKAKQPAKVYTNKDLKPVPPPSTPPPATASGEPAASAAESPAESPKADKGGAKAGQTAADAAADVAKKPEYWRQRSNDLQTALDRDQTYLDAVQSRINALTTDFVNRDDPAQRAVIERERNRNLAELQRLQKALETDRKAIVDFQEEARRAGVPPGWIR